MSVTTAFALRRNYTGSVYGGTPTWLQFQVPTMRVRDRPRPRALLGNNLACGDGITGPANTASPAVQAVNTWTSTFVPQGATPNAYTTTVTPSTACQNITVANSDGNWLIAYLAWDSANFAAQPMSPSVGDDAHNLWEPLGTALTTSLCSVTIWAAPAARPAQTVYVSANAATTVRAAVIQEFTGLAAGLAVTGYQSAAVSGTAQAAATAALPAPPAAALVLTCGAYDNAAYSTTAVLTGGGWNTPVNLPSQNTGYGYDLILGTSWQVTTGAATARWQPAAAGNGTSLDVTAVTAGVLTAQPPPAQLSANWPLIQLQAALGTAGGGPAGQNTPPDQRIWADISGRLLSWDETRGAQYELDQIQAAQVNAQLDNHDGALTPRPPWAITATGNSANATTITVSVPDAAQVTVSDWFQIYPTSQTYPYSGAGTPQAAVFQVTAVNTATGLVTFTPAAASPPVTGNVAQSGSLAPVPLGQVTSYVPVRLLHTWNGRTSVSFGGYSERWPQDWNPDSWWQQSHAIFTDVWSLINGQMRTIGQAEILNDGPVAYWPLGDDNGTAAAPTLAAANIAATSYGQLIVRQSKYGTGGATYSFGSSSGTGAPSGSNTWRQQGLAATETSQGYTLFFQPASPYQPLPLTITGWFEVDAAAPSGPVLMSVKSFAGPIAQVSIAAETGYLTFSWWDRFSGQQFEITVNASQNWGNGTWFMVTMQLTQSSWDVIINGGLDLGLNGIADLPPYWGWVSFCGQADANYSGYMYNGGVAHCALFNYLVSPLRVLTEYLATAGALAETPGVNVSGDTCGRRIERLLEAGGYTGPKCVDVTSTTDNPNLTVPATDTSGQQASAAVQAVSESDGGVLFIAGDGNLFYRSAAANYCRPAAWTLGELTSAGEIPYLPDASLDFDPTHIANDISLQQLGGPVITPGSALSPFIAASKAQFGDITYTPTVYLADTQKVTDLANWVAQTQGAPAMRVYQVTVDAAKTVAAWPMVLHADIGDVVIFHRRNPNMGPPVITLTTIIIKLQRSLTWSSGTGTLKLVLSPYYAAALSTNSATYGYPNGTVRLAR